MKVSSSTACNLISTQMTDKSKEKLLAGDSTEATQDQLSKSLHLKILDRTIRDIASTEKKYQLAAYDHIRSQHFLEQVEKAGVDKKIQETLLESQLLSGVQKKKLVSELVKYIND